ncbi:MAG: ATP-binding protein [Verrucomicrobiota bacterium]|jgi:signal transduction histidine kinase
MCRATLTGCVLVPALFLASAGRGCAEQAAPWRVYTAATGFPESSFRSVTIAENGAILAVNSFSSAVCQFDGYEAKSIPLPDAAAGRVYQSPAGQLWTLSPKGLWAMKEGAWRLYPVPELVAACRSAPGREIPLCPIRQNVVLCLLPDRLVEVNAEAPGDARLQTLREASRTGIGEFSAMTVGAGDELWVVGETGLAQVSGPQRSLSAASEWREFIPPPSLRIHHLQRPEPDENGLTLVADAAEEGEKTQVRFDGANWQARALGATNIQFAWRGPDNTTWAAASNALYQWRGGELAVVAELSPRMYLDVEVDWRGTFWLATSDGLVRFTPSLWRGPEPGATVNATVRRLAEGGRLTDVAGQILSFDSDPAPAAVLVTAQGRVRSRPLGLLRDGRVCFENIPLDGARPGRRLETGDGTNFQPLPFSPPDTGKEGEVSCLLETQTGDIWLGGTFGTAWLHDRWTVFSASDSTAPQGVCHLVELPNGRIWSASREKIWGFDGKNWALVRSGLNHINAMIPARDGSVWVGAESGVARFFRGNWIENGADEGLAGGGIRALCEDQRGGIWAVGAMGLERFHPEADSDPPRTLLHPMSDKEKNIPEDGVIVVSFGGADKWHITAPGRLLYSHRLDEGEWSPFADAASVTFSDLAPGKHYFQARAMDRAGNVDPDPAHLEFAVVLPWFKESRLVLIASAGTAAALFFAGLAYKRHRQLVLSYAEVEKQVAERTRELGLASQELVQSQKMRALGTLAAGIAHDFNNILSIIKGSTQIIEDNLGNPEKIRTRADRIKTVVDQGSAVVQALLGFSRGSDEVMECCEINPVVDNTLKLLGDRFLREVEMRFERGADLPGVRASQSLVQQILLNFIFNAAESMTGRKRIVITTARPGPLPAGMALPPGAAGAYVSVSVRDFGCGIPPENIGRVFEPFFTTKSFSTRRGTGLGLSIVYELAKKMGAGLAVESTVGQGTVFSLVLPAEKAG